MTVLKNIQITNAKHISLKRFQAYNPSSKELSQQTQYVKFQFFSY